MSEWLVAFCVIANMVLTACFLAALLLFWRHDRANAQVQREDLISFIKQTHGALLRVKGKPQAGPFSEGQQQMDFGAVRASTPRPRNGAELARDVQFPVRG